MIVVLLCFIIMFYDFLCIMYYPTALSVLNYTAPPAVIVAFPVVRCLWHFRITPGPWSTLSLPTSCTIDTTTSTGSSVTGGYYTNTVTEILQQCRDYHCNIATITAKSLLSLSICHSSSSFVHALHCYCHHSIYQP